MRLKSLLIVFCTAILSSVVIAQNNLTTPDKEVATLETSMGKIVIEFYPGAAPNHVANFKKLAKSGFYNGTKFHRVIPGFMIQGGDPNSKDNDRSNDGTGDSGTNVKAEFSKISHKRGIVSMARAADPDSASCQFFIVVKDSPFLDGKYSVFGNVIQGMDVADKIVNAPRDPNDNPLQAITITKVTIGPRPAK
jgi:peptidyl-prolyl cis-trans isomerase B (cyclophilin B)